VSHQTYTEKNGSSCLVLISLKRDRNAPFYSKCCTFTRLPAAEARFTRCFPCFIQGYTFLTRVFAHRTRHTHKFHTRSCRPRKLVFLGPLLAVLVNLRVWWFLVLWFLEGFSPSTQAVVQLPLPDKRWYSTVLSFGTPEGAAGSDLPADLAEMG